MTNHNKDLFDLMHNNRICSAWVATELGMYDSNFCRMMRLPLKPKRREQVLAAIKKLSKEVRADG